MPRWLISERGSVSLISIMVAVSTLLIMMMLVDRAQVQYLIRTGNQIADFAAESVTVAPPHQQTWTLKWHIRVSGQEWYTVTESFCVEWSPDGSCSTTDTATHMDLRPAKREHWVSDTEVRQNWVKAMGCMEARQPQEGEPKDGDFSCDASSVTVLDWYVTFTGAAETVAKGTFNGNWHSVGRTSATNVRVQGNSGGRCPNNYYPADIVDHSSDDLAENEFRQVQVQATVTFQSIFGLWGDLHRDVTGAAVVQIPQLTFVKSVAPKPC